MQEGDGQMLADALTKASGEPSKFSVGLPRFILWLMSRDLYAMIEWFEKGGLKVRSDSRVHVSGGSASC